MKKWVLVVTLFCFTVSCVQASNGECGWFIGAAIDGSEAQGLIKYNRKNTEQLQQLFDEVDDLTWSEKRHEMIRLIIRRADPNIVKQFDGSPLLHDAVMKGDIAFAERLLDRNADPNSQNFEKETPLFFARSAAMITLLASRGANCKHKLPNGDDLFKNAIVQNFPKECFDQLWKLNGDSEKKKNYECSEVSDKLIEKRNCVIL
jgi:ankyrin repeat protein